MVSAGAWTSVVAYGRYEELPDTDQMHDAREFAWSLLQQRAQWWEPGAVKPTVDAASSTVIPVFYRIHILEISGRWATVETKASSSDGHVIASTAGYSQRKNLQGEVGLARVYRRCGVFPRHRAPGAPVGTALLPAVPAAAHLPAHAPVHAWRPWGPQLRRRAQARPARKRRQQMNDSMSAYGLWRIR